VALHINVSTLTTIKSAPCSLYNRPCGACICRRDPHKTEIQSAPFSAQNIIQFTNVRFTLIIKFPFYTYISIFMLWWFSSFCKFKLDFSVSIKYHKTSCAAWNNVPWWQSLIPMDQYQTYRVAAESTDSHSYFMIQPILIDNLFASVLVDSWK